MKVSISDLMRDDFVVKCKTEKELDDYKAILLSHGFLEISYGKLIREFPTYVKARRTMYFVVNDSSFECDGSDIVSFKNLQIEDGPKKFDPYRFLNGGFYVRCDNKKDAGMFCDIIGYLGASWKYDGVATRENSHWGYSESNGGMIMYVCENDHVYWVNKKVQGIEVFNYRDIDFTGTIPFRIEDFTNEKLVVCCYDNRDSNGFTSQLLGRDSTLVEKEFGYMNFYYINGVPCTSGVNISNIKAPRIPYRFFKFEKDIDGTFCPFVKTGKSQCVPGCIFFGNDGCKLGFLKKM